MYILCPISVALIIDTDKLSPAICFQFFVLVIALFVRSPAICLVLMEII